MNKVAEKERELNVKMLQLEREAAGENRDTGGKAAV